MLRSFSIVLLSKSSCIVRQTNQHCSVILCCCFQEMKKKKEKKEKKCNVSCLVDRRTTFCTIPTLQTLWNPCRELPGITGHVLTSLKRATKWVFILSHKNSTLWRDVSVQKYVDHTEERSMPSLASTNVSETTNQLNNKDDFEEIAFNNVHVVFFGAIRAQSVKRMVSTHPDFWEIVTWKREEKYTVKRRFTSYDSKNFKKNPARSTKLLNLQVMKHT